MACQITLYDFLGAPKNDGGGWQYITGPASATLNVDGAGDATYVLNADIGSQTQGELTTIDVSGTTAGTYVFQYTVGADCQDEATVTVTVNDGAIALLNYNPTICTSSDVEYNLFDFVQGGDGLGTGTAPADTDGEWSNTGTSSSGYTSNVDPTLATFNPFGLTAGNYLFTYTVDHSNDEEPGCENCEATSLLTIAVTDAANAGVDGTATVCNLQTGV